MILFLDLQFLSYNLNMNELNSHNFDAKTTLFSGQTFLWSRQGNDLIGSFKNKIIILSERRNKWYWQTYPNKDDFDFVKNYLNLDFDGQKFITSTNDEHIRSSFSKYPGLRVLKQPFEETILSFILASNKNIKAIRKTFNFLKGKQNRYIKVDNKKYFFFPSIEFINDVDISVLQESGAGYRVKYLKDLANKFETIKTKGDFSEIANSLKKVNGIGDKIADCIMTFSLGFNNITPINRWSERIITELYNDFYFEKVLR